MVKKLWSAIWFEIIRVILTIRHDIPAFEIPPFGLW